MPKNKKEGVIFTTLMCSLMVIGMSVYNLWLHDNLMLSAFLTGLIPGFIVALFLDVFVIGIVAKKIAFLLPINRNNKMQLILTISVLMVMGMVTCMSLFGMVMQNGVSNFLLVDYFNAWKMNLIMALPLQIIFVGPISRQILKIIQDKR